MMKREEILLEYWYAIVAIFCRHYEPPKRIEEVAQYSRREATILIETY